MVKSSARRVFCGRVTSTLAFITLFGFLALLPARSALALTASSETATGTETDAASYVPGEIVVGFRSTGPHSITGCVDCVLNIGRSLFRITNDQSISLDTLFTQYNVLSVRPVFRTALEEATIPGPDPKSVSALETFHANRRAAALARYPQRTARAPQNYAFPNLAHVYRIQVPPHVDVKAAAAALAADPHVEFAHPSPRIQAQFRPNDPFIQHDAVPNSWGQAYPDLWGLQAINAEAAWDRSTGAGTLIAIVDSGVDYTHEDLAAHIWVNPGEDLNLNSQVDGTNTCPTPNGDYNCVDDDGNGYVDDLRGMNFASCDVFTPICIPTPFGCIPVPVCFDPQEPTNDPIDHNGHGTHVAGTAAAIGNNGTGIVGVAWNATVMPVRILSGEGILAFSTDAAAGLEYAARMGADVINNSWGCTGACPSDAVIEMAVREAYGLGAVVVFSAGNGGIDVRLVSPQNMPETIAVGAMTPANTRTAFSNYGELIDLVAPGGGTLPSPRYPGCHADRNILSLRSALTWADDWPLCLSVGVGAPDPDSHYLRQAGTSMAAPHVTGAAALLISGGAVPLRSPEDVQHALKLTAFDLGPSGDDMIFGAGNVDVGEATALSSLPQLSIAYPQRDQLLDPAQASVIPISGYAAAPDFQSYELFVRRGADPWQSISGKRFAPVTNGLLMNWNISGALPGVHTLKLTITLQSGRNVSEYLPILMKSNGLSITSDGLASPDRGPAVHDNRVIWVHEDPAFGYQMFTCLYDQSTGTCPPQLLSSWVVTPDDMSPVHVLSHDHILQGGRGDLDICTIDTVTNTCWPQPISHGKPHSVQFDMDGDLIVWTDLRNSAFSQVYACQFDEETVTCPEVKIAGAALSNAIQPSVWRRHIVWVENKEVFHCLFDSATGSCPAQRLTTNAWASTPSISGNHIVWQDQRNHLPNPIYDIYHCTYDPLTGACPVERLTTSGTHGDPHVWGETVIWLQSTPQLSQVMYHNLRTGQTAPLLPSATSQTQPRIWHNMVTFSEADDVRLFDLRELGHVNEFPSLSHIGDMTFPEGPAAFAESIIASDPDNDTLTLQGALAGGASLESLFCSLSSAGAFAGAGTVAGTISKFFTCNPSVNYVTAVTGSQSFRAVFVASDGVLQDWAEPLVTITDATPPLTGIILASDSTPLPFIAVKLYGVGDDGKKVKLTGMTNASGYYRFGGVPAGTYRISPRATGYSFAPLTADGIRWPSDTPISPFIDTLGTAPRAVANTQSISGYVTDAQGQPVPHASIKLKSNTTAVGIRVRLFALTDESGFYLLDHLPPGTYKLSARLPRDAGFGTLTPRSVTLELTNSPQTQVNFVAGQ